VSRVPELLEREPPASAVTAPDAGPVVGEERRPQIQGCVEVVTASRIAGWAADRAAPEAPVAVELFVQGRRLAQARADRLRPDLVKAGIGGGRHGFELLPTEPVEPGAPGLRVVVRGPGDLAFVLPRRDPARPTGEAAALPAALDGVVERLAALEALVARHGETVETTQARLELVLARIEARLGEIPPPTVGSGLRRVVAALGIVTALCVAAAIGSFVQG
jgi:hypothetical protein